MNHGNLRRRRRRGVEKRDEYFSCKRAKSDHKCSGVAELAVNFHPEHPEQRVQACRGQGKQDYYQQQLRLTSSNLHTDVITTVYQMCIPVSLRCSYEESFQVNYWSAHWSWKYPAWSSWRWKEWCCQGNQQQRNALLYIWVLCHYYTLSSRPFSLPQVQTGWGFWGTECWALTLDSGVRDSSGHDFPDKLGRTHIPVNLFSQPIKCHRYMLKSML